MQIKCILLVIQSLVAIYHTAPIENTSNYDGENKFPIHNDQDIIGQSCNSSCGEEITHIICNEDTKSCECSTQYPVYLSRNKECVKSALIGEQCMHMESCRYNDIFSVCSQINHNAYCRCIEGYHEVEFTSRDVMTKTICSKNTAPEGKNVSTLLLTLGGVAVLSTLICFVLKLYVKKSHPYERTTLSNGARILSATEIVQVARTLQANSRPTSTRRPSRGVAVSSSRATAARAAAIILVSCHLPAQDSSRSLGESSLSETSNQNSPRSFSARQFKRENDAKMAKIQRLGHQSSRSSLEQCSSRSNFDSTSRQSELHLNATSSKANETEADCE